MAPWQSINRAGWLLPLALLPACSERVPEPLYRIVGSSVMYSDGIHGEQGSSPGCLSARGPVLRDVEIGVKEREGGYTITEVGGCEIDVELEGSALIGRNVACRLDPSDLLTLLGLKERVYESFRLDLDTGAVAYRFHALQATAGEELPLTACAFFEGQVLPEGEAAALSGGKVAVYTDGTWTTSQLLGGAEECATPRNGGAASGRMIVLDDGAYLWEALGCTLRPGTDLKVQCGGGELNGYALPEIEVQRFVMGDTMEISGVMTLDTYSYCFSLEAP